MDPEDLDNLGSTDPIALLEEDLLTREGKPRRPVPIPQRTGLNGLLSRGTNLAPAKNPELLQSALEEIFDQHGVLAHEFKLQRPNIYGVNVHADLPVLASHFDFSVYNDPKASKALNKALDDSLTLGGKYSITNKEIRKAASALEPYVRSGNLQLLMNLGAARGPQLNPLVMREALVAALMLEGQVTAPDAAGFSRATRLQTRAVAEMAVASRKAQLDKGLAFGLGSKQLAKGLPYANIGAASIGLRRGRGAFSVPFVPTLFNEGGALYPIGKAIRKNIQEVHNATEGLSAARRHLDVPARAKLIVDTILNSTSTLDQDRLFSILGTNPPNFAKAFAKDPARMSVRLLGVLRSTDPDIDLALPLQERQLLADQIEQAATLDRKPRTKGVRKSDGLPSKSKLAEVAKLEGNVTETQALSELKKIARKMPGVDPAIRKGGGRALKVLALASILSAGLMAVGGGSVGEDAA